MLFCEHLEKMMTEHGVKAVDIHRITGLKKPYISKMLSGSLIPPSYSTVETVMDAVGLTLEERVVLTDAYQKTRTTEEGIKLWRAFTTLYSLKIPAAAKRKTSGTKGIENACILTGDALTDAVCALAGSAKGTLTLLYVPPVSSGSAADRICSVFGSIPADTEIKWLMPFGTDGNVGLEDFSDLTYCLPLMTLRPCAVTKYPTDLESFFGDSVFPFFILNDSELIVFDRDISTGQYFRDEKLLALYRKKYTNGGKVLREPFMRSFEDPAQVITFIEQGVAQVASADYDYYIFANTPCIVFDLPKAVISDKVADGFDSDMIATMYVSLLRNIVTSANTFTDIFSLSGLIDYLDNDEFYELGKKFSKSMDREFRRNALKQYIGQAEDQQEFGAFGIKIPGFNINAFIGANLLSTGLILLMYGFEEKTVIMTIDEKSIADMLIKYIGELRKSGLIAGKEETISFVHNELSKRE